MMMNCREGSQRSRKHDLDYAAAVIVNADVICACVM